MHQAEGMLADMPPSPLLEVKFDGEEGSGLGPTLEFYALVSEELTRNGQGLWRGDDGSSTGNFMIKKN